MCEPKEDQVVPETPVELIMDHLSICMAGRRAARALCAMSTEQLQQVGQQIARKEKALKKRRWKQKLLWEAAPPPPGRPTKTADGKRKYYCYAERLHRQDYNKWSGDK